MEPEVTVHQCTPSQIVNLKRYVFAGLAALGIIVLAIATDTPVLFALLALPLGYAFWKYMEIKATKFTLTDQRLIVSTGIFTKQFTAKGLQWPAKYMYVRSFKYDAQLEVWMSMAVNGGTALYLSYGKYAAVGKATMIVQEKLPFRPS